MKLRVVAFLAAMLLGLLPAPEAGAHASLVRSEPVDGAVAAQPPAVLKLIFNEPVSPLVIRLIGPSGEVMAPKVGAENSTVTITPPRLRQGTHVLSWRVVSADGHPVGGAVLFSVGTASSTPAAGAQSEGSASVHAALWAARFLIYVGLLVGVGGAFFQAWIAEPGTRPASMWIVATIEVALLATALSVGVQGLDALDLPLSEIVETLPWESGYGTSYGSTALAAAGALVAGMCAYASRSVWVARILSLAALLGVGFALTLSGHATTAEPHALTRPSVFLHGVGVAFWIGSLIPLVAALRAAVRGDASLARFSRVIPYPLVALVVTGVALATVQLDRVDALWSTDYGLVLTGKLAALGALLALACANRFLLVPRYQAAGRAAVRPLQTSIVAEFALALVILAIVPLWRFTPPPRALAAEPVAIHFHGERAMTQIDITPARGRGAHVNVLVLDGEMKPTTVKEVTLVFSNPAAGIEPVRRLAQSEGESLWSIDDLRIPLPGIWRLRVDVLISDFDKEILEDNVVLPRLP